MPIVHPTTQVWHRYSFEYISNTTNKNNAYQLSTEKFPNPFQQTKLSKDGDCLERQRKLKLQQLEEEKKIQQEFLERKYKILYGNDIPSSTNTNNNNSNHFSSSS